MIERDFWLSLRDGLLVQVDAIERKLELQPRTAELRQRARQDRIEITKHTEREARETCNEADHNNAQC